MLSVMAFSTQLCRFPASRTDIALPENPTRIRCQKPFSIRCSADSPSAAVGSDFNPKVFRKNLTRSKNYNRKGFGHKEETLQLMNSEYTSMFLESSSELVFDFFDVLLNRIVYKNLVLSFWVCVFFRFRVRWRERDWISHCWFVLVRWDGFLTFHEKWSLFSFLIVLGVFLSHAAV